MQAASQCYALQSFVAEPPLQAFLTMLFHLKPLSRPLPSLQSE